MADKSSGDMSIPRDICASPVLDFLEQLHARYAACDEGEVATYIPELAKADPDWFGICLVTAGGSVYEMGDSQQQFTIQSISKPFVYGLALEDNTRADVLAKIGAEPTGEAFNAISLEPGTGRPRNPMINAGAIAAAGLVAGKSHATRLQRLLDTFSLYAGRRLEVDDAIYRSESETGHRNRAIGHMLRNFGILTEPPDPVVDLYFKQCSISVTCRDLGVMAATLANRGINPLTGRQAIRGEYVESVLSVMGSCGMYDYAGEWLYRIGMPAKSGVAGGILAVLPGQIGIGVFSPRLDVRGNSVRGIRVCDDFSRWADLHLFNRPPAQHSVIRLKFTGAQVNSTRMRTDEEALALRELGSAIRVYQLQGNLEFASTEVVVRDVIENLSGAQFVIFDLKRALSLNESSARLFQELLLKLADRGITVLFTHMSAASLLRRYCKAKLGERFAQLFHSFEDNDPALESCEERLLQSRFQEPAESRTASRADYQLFAGLTTDELAVVSALLERRSYPKSTVIVRLGDTAQELFIVSRGLAAVTVTVSGGGQKIIASFGPGFAFGEMAILDRAPRSASVTAKTALECDLLKLEDFARLGETHPHIQIVLLRNLATALSGRLRKANREFSVFD